MRYSCHQCEFFAVLQIFYSFILRFVEESPTTIPGNLAGKHKSTLSRSETAQAIAWRKIFQQVKEAKLQMVTSQTDGDKTALRLICCLGNCICVKCLAPEFFFLILAHPVYKM